MKVDSRQLLAAAWCALILLATANGGVTGACSSDERNVELLSGWVDFYVRRMYTVGQDCWNRPVLIHRSLSPPHLPQLPPPHRLPHSGAWRCE